MNNPKGKRLNPAQDIAESVIYKWKGILDLTVHSKTLNYSHVLSIDIYLYCYTSIQ